MISKLLGENDPYCDDLITHLWRDKDQLWWSEVHLDRKITLMSLLTQAKGSILFTRFNGTNSETVPLSEVIYIFKNDAIDTEKEIIESLSFHAKYNKTVWALMTRKQKLNVLVPNYQGNLLDLVLLLYRHLRNVE